MDLECKHKDTNFKDLPCGTHIEICKVCGKSREVWETGSSEWLQVNVFDAANAIEKVCKESLEIPKIAPEEALTTILSKGYSRIFSPRVMTKKHQSMYVVDILGIGMHESASESFGIYKDEDYQKIMNDPTWLPEQARVAFFKMADKINTSMDQVFFHSEPNTDVYIVMGMHPPNYYLGKTITSIADPSNGVVITLEMDMKNKLGPTWTINCLWGVLVDKVVKTKVE